MELSTRFEPKQHEQAIYAAWESSGGFQPRASGTGNGKTFCVMIPPPNVTGVLHMGHALNNTIQDIAVRHRRMEGYEVLWVPGTDHAGIATQAVVERKLYQERALRREDMGREAFLAEVWKWREEFGGRILDQLKRLGCSCDWSRLRFTLEEGMSRAVREAFVRLWEKGLVYRAARLVNWDCVLETAVSDDEIEYVAQKSQLYYVRYPFADQQGADQEGGFVTVATTRPESMFGDTAVAVHPSDERYRGMVGRRLRLPFIGRVIPLLSDESVDPQFGTGAVKVTPGHDPADYERGARHKLPIVIALAKNGALNAEAGPFQGLSREEARKRVVAELEQLGLIEKVERIEHNVPISDRSKSIIEPLVSEQWFVQMKPLAGPAIEAVRSGALRFVPERWFKVYLDWLENVHDWCISRQLWWGHRIPVWYDVDGVPFASREDLAIGSLHPKTGKPIVRQDEDVLDTWASSWLWPFATLGWPERTEDFRRFYPTQFLSTARDIIYLWVARMVMGGYEFLDELPVEKRCPFAVCNVHATVLDAKGRRMSKSLGNGIDPLEMVDRFGADAVRFSLILLTREGQDTKLSEDRLEQGWRFTNKVWNAARFVLTNLASAVDRCAPGELRLEDRWIRSRLCSVRGQVTAALDDYRLNDAAQALYRFIWNDFCDWYVELCKPRIAADDADAVAARGTLARVLKDMLALLHPFAPYITEVLWRSLHEALAARGGGGGGDGVAPMLMNAPWPQEGDLAFDEAAEADMGVIQDLVRAVRNVRALTSIGERKPLRALIAAARAEDRRVLNEHGSTACALAFLDSYRVCERAERPPQSAVALSGGIEVFVELGEQVDVKALLEVLSRRTEKLRKGIEASERKLANREFVERADAEVVATERERRAELAAELELVERNVQGLAENAQC